MILIFDFSQNHYKETFIRLISAKLEFKEFLTFPKILFFFISLLKTVVDKTRLILVSQFFNI